MRKPVGEIVRGILESGRAQSCTHLDQIQEVTPSTEDGCEDCLKIGDTWVHLRLCLMCGYVGCCDSSKNRHASRHSQEKGHPVVLSFEPGENWIWCYVDRAFLVGGRDSE